MKYLLIHLCIWTFSWVPQPKFTEPQLPQVPTRVVCAATRNGLPGLGAESKNYARYCVAVSRELDKLQRSSREIRASWTRGARR